MQRSTAKQFHVPGRRVYYLFRLLSKPIIYRNLSCLFCDKTPVTYTNELFDLKYTKDIEQSSRAIF